MNISKAAVSHQLREL
ncbi:hypothetical protein KQI61_15930 [Anaerocolumna aminovalerica]|nr:hypothetical protein [Anaerocolumna aminovalerica]